MINPQTCTCFRLLGPCFKTGQMKHHHHKLPNVHRHKAQWSKHTVQHMQRLCMSCLGMITPTTAHAPSCSQYWHSKATQTCKTRHTICIHKHRLRKFVRNNASICTLQSWFSRAFHLLSLQQFQVLLTFFSKSFSHFPHGTCLLSFPTQQFTLGEVYHQFCTPLPRSTTLKNTPRIKDCTWQTRVSLSLLLFFQKRRMHTSIGNAIETCKPKPKVWTSRLSHSLFIRHYYRSPCQFIFLCLLICLNSAGLLVSHQADNKATQFS